MEKLILWEFLYCSCIHESSFMTVSLHRTEEGANRAMEIHKAFEEKEFNDLYKDSGIEPAAPFGHFEAWKIQQIEVQD